MIGPVVWNESHTGFVAVESCCVKVIVAALCWTPLLVVTVTAPSVAPFMTVTELVPSQLTAYAPLG